MHVVPWQHPAQLLALQLEDGGAQAPLWQVSLPLHGPQADPADPLPQSEVISLATGRQVVPSQHPAQLLLPQAGPPSAPTQTPSRHCSPAPTAVQS